MDGAPYAWGSSTPSPRKPWPPMPFLASVSCNAQAIRATGIPMIYLFRTLRAHWLHTHLLAGLISHPSTGSKARLISLRWTQGPSRVYSWLAQTCWASVQDMRPMGSAEGKVTLVSLSLTDVTSVNTHWDCSCPLGMVTLTLPHSNLA